MTKIHELPVFPKTFAEFFAGIGLMRMGLESAGWNILYANDIDKTKERLYNAHFQDKNNHFHLGDIHMLDADSIPDISLATASFPCTDLSLAGRREVLAGQHSSAFWGFINVLKNMADRRPPIVLLENVEGFLSSNKGKDFEDALLALNELGYAVDAFVINASFFVPQSRLRLFIVGRQKKNNGGYVMDKQQLSIYQDHIRPKKLADFILDHPQINWSIRSLPNLPKERLNSLKDIVDDPPDNSIDWWNQERVEYLLNQTFERHRNLIELLKKGNEYTYLTAFRRVREGKSMAEIRSDGIAGCLRTPKGGSARQILLRVGKGELKIRFISPRECSRLMGAGDYQITGSFNESLFGFGDAVCVPVVTWIANNYLNPLLTEINHSAARYESAYGRQTQTVAIGV